MHLNSHGCIFSLILAKSASLSIDFVAFLLPLKFALQSIWTVFHVCFIFTLPFVQFFWTDIGNVTSSFQCCTSEWTCCCFYSCVCVGGDNWFPRGRGRSNSLSTPWALLLNLPLSLSLQGTLDVGMIDSVCASDNPERWGPASNITSRLWLFFVQTCFTHSVSHTVAKWRNQTVSVR